MAAHDRLQRSSMRMDPRGRLTGRVGVSTQTWEMIIGHYQGPLLIAAVIHSPHLSSVEIEWSGTAHFGARTFLSVRWFPNLDFSHSFLFFRFPFWVFPVPAPGPPAVSSLSSLLDYLDSSLVTL